ncbi:hypothetical protein [Mycolicibacterium sp.]|uniref:hypothetical protein n=1 Tax=Mycolicibacterium sp. TaxID=2320850 RepID=UPI001A2518B3|nr:hypothetical protein [Mycolicibacterium sp.]MBJ7337037.1 hypothetical protein [Mycolicibacterium sp.]
MKKLVDTMSDLTRFLRPAGGAHGLGQAHVPLLELMPRRQTMAGPEWSDTSSRVVRA